MDQQIAKLVEIYSEAPLRFFHEREIHCAFYEVSREILGSAETKDKEEIHLLRYEYNTLWRYRRSGVEREQRFAERHSDSADVGSVDFALLDRDFVRNHPYLAVMNKDELIRATFRSSPWPPNELSPIIERALEFKMARVHPIGPANEGHAVRLSDFNAMAIEVPMDCRKLARERVRVAYLVAFSHRTSQDWFNEAAVAALFADCIQEWKRYYDGPARKIEDQLRLLFVLPDRCFRWGSWKSAFPNEIYVKCGSPE